VGVGTTTSGARLISWGRLKRDLLARHPALPRGARLWFTSVPNGTGIGEPWFDPAFRCMVSGFDAHGGLLPELRRASAGAPRDRDYFFRFDVDALGLGRDRPGCGGHRTRAPREIRNGPATTATWRSCSETPATGMAPPRRFEKLMHEFPADPQYPRNLSVCLGSLGDSAGMRRNLRLADSLQAAHAARGAR
jgi:hypothetical protein